jgi:urease accessory protein
MPGREGTASKIVAALAVPVLAMALFCEPALAHHPMGGEAPQTFWHGLLSGIGHPVIGIDHLAFIVGIALVGAVVPGGLLLAATFVGASIMGVLGHLAGLPLSYVEPAVAATVLVAGLVVASGTDVGIRAWSGLALLAGLLHGYAYGEAVVGSQFGAVGAYLLGLALVQLAIAASVVTLGRLLLTNGGRATRRLAGAGVGLSVLGAVLLVGSLVQA